MHLIKLGLYLTQQYGYFEYLGCIVSNLNDRLFGEEELNRSIK